MEREPITFCWHDGPAVLALTAQRQTVQVLHLRSAPEAERFTQLVSRLAERGYVWLIRIDGAPCLMLDGGEGNRCADAKEQRVFVGA